jgi:hypothetical protein
MNAPRPEAELDGGPPHAESAGDTTTAPQVSDPGELLPPYDDDGR